jgi:hypothetical protein
MDSKTFNSLSEAYSAVYTDNVEETYTVTAADKKGNTKAYQNYKAGMKKKDGSPMYKSADHMDEEKKELPKNKMFRKAGNLGRDAVSSSATDDQRQKAYDRSKKIVKTLNKANEEVEAEGYVPMDSAKKEKIGRQSNKAYAKEVVAARHGKEKEANKQMQRRIAMQDPAGRKAALKKEELEATGLFTEEEINAILEADEHFDEAMSSYDRNRKRAAQRAADRNAARDAGKTGVVPGVGYVTPRREKESYTDEKGTERHKSGAKMP